MTYQPASILTIRGVCKGGNFRQAAVLASQWRTRFGLVCTRKHLRYRNLMADEFLEHTGRDLRQNSLMTHRTITLLFLSGGLCAAQSINPNAGPPTYHT